MYEESFARYRVKSFEIAVDNLLAKWRQRERERKREREKFGQFSNLGGKSKSGNVREHQREKAAIKSAENGIYGSCNVPHLSPPAGLNYVNKHYLPDSVARTHGTKDSFFSFIFCFRPKLKSDEFARNSNRRTEMNNYQAPFSFAESE